MSYLLDTCVFSEHTRKRPDPKVLAWVDGIEETRLHISVLSLGEVRQGAAQVANAGKTRRLIAWLEDQLLVRFERRVLPVDADVALDWGRLRGSLLRKGTTVPLFDSLIAATARVHGLVLVTRNVLDFANLEVEVVNPWQ